ncbi:ABC-type polysaccharide/polyol phosphate export system, permease component [Clostridium pasteurianum DSM 525 = ATCC 6013]|uniref:Transport permease protein n=1 Tax=Clostridium pasteurianum DSM 525 = ATCC 6013 TaxID=1262449 RepID=A0A0H3J3G6_CLOPA|nr:ABC transporter permease [Clostridium pasteurianum]AJA48461.1 ABC-type polysaccharide/polyol phosphate export system, permease component [Clostridium pasteurianum DSM 525 = ATCC 6013]AJA52449.1 ABC-type polysaccharide/polyol phosphate export system, permease component [Clostridium pasteurianum DSM 525 = ATCC 6013]AOZ75703.1 transporter [Clostridium pasteurianum DSM 525 = ATCC 6013]AOZ79499.1 transporter [Clostridium pasteurianum]ELP60391.1 ABC transporter [Clostridium pasteurianum DSM 525 =
MQVIAALWFRNLKIFARNRVQLVFTIIMPFFFLYVFSAIFKNDNISNPVNYMLAGIVITTVFQTAITIATSTIEDIVSGFMKEVLVSPVKRMQIAAGQLLSAATIATLQGIIILFIGYFIGLKFTSFITPFAVIVVMAAVGLVFSGLGLFLAALVKNSQTFQIVITAITMPLTFLCGAYIPLSLLPKILQYFAYLNPMTYTTAFFRTIILEKTSLTTEQLIEEQLAFKIGNFVITPTISMLIVIIFGLVFLLLATLVFSKVDFSRINRSKSKEADIWS